MAEIDEVTSASEEPKTEEPYSARLSEAPSKSTIPILLHPRIIASCQVSMTKRNSFSIGLSGGSLPSFISSLPASFEKTGIKPQWEKWQVFLVDERIVPSSDENSNLKAIKEAFLDQVPIPPEQIYGINDEMATPSQVAEQYEETVIKPLLEKSSGKFDLLLLGFGTDGHTCSLFPDHKLLEEKEKLVASLDDSPKPPPERITLTLKALNEHVRNVIFVGAGKEKNAVLKQLWDTDEQRSTVITMRDPAPFPCAMVRPKDGQVTWVVDKDALHGEEE